MNSKEIKNPLLRPYNMRSTMTLLNPFIRYPFLCVDFSCFGSAMEDRFDHVVGKGGIFQGVDKVRIEGDPLGHPHQLREALGLMGGMTLLHLDLPDSWKIPRYFPNLSISSYDSIFQKPSLFM